MFSTLIALAVVASLDPELQRCRAIENDIERLQCFDKAIPAEAERTAPRPRADLTDPRTLADVYLASALPDGKGVRGYKVSDPLPCEQVDEYSANFSDTCICITYKAKNEFGGYLPYTKVALPIENTEGGDWSPSGLQSSIRTIEGDQACSAANLSERDPAMIERFVR